MFSASALAAPAIVQSDSSLKFDDVKLQQVLTQISDKEPNLNIVFYSTNTVSPNTVILPNGTKVNRAVYANDNFIGSIKKPNYISFYYNKDDSNPNKGSFSANVGSDFRTFISKEDISNGIVKPNISKYLPQDPEAFIPVVAEQVVVQIKAKQQQIEREIENKRLQVIKDVESKQAWDNAIKVVIFSFIIVLVFAIVYYLIKTIVKHLNNSLEEYKKYKELLDQTYTNYSLFVEQSTYLNGYTGATAEKTKDLLDEVTRINQLYLDLKALPKFINVVLNNSTWSNYTSNLDNMSGSLSNLLSLIKQFLTSIEGLSGTDPLAEIIRLEELKDKQTKLDSLVSVFNQQYQDGSEFLANSLVHGRSNQGKAILDSNYDINAKIDFYNDSLEIINKEVTLINRLSKLKQSVKEVASYIINNKNTYYSNLNPITSEVKDWAQNLLITASNYNNYFELSNVETIKQELDFFAIDYQQQDAQYRVINERKASLINKVNITVPTKFILIQDRLLKEIREVTINSDYNLTEQTLDKLEKEVNTLIKDVNAYKSRQAKLSNYSGTRKTELTKQLDSNNYSNFDVLIVNYNDEDERTKRASYSSSSYSSYNSSPSSYSNDNSSYSYGSSSSSSSSWSSSSSDDSYSSSSSNDSSSSSSSSDDSW